MDLPSSSQPAKLQRTWSLWEKRGIRKPTYIESCTRLFDLGTVEDFWKGYNFSPKITFVFLYFIFLTS